MSKIRLYPYPRLDPAAVMWSPWKVTLDGKPVAIEEVADQWDPKALITVGIAVEVSPNVLSDVGADEAYLVMEVACRDTAYTAPSRVKLLTPEGSPSRGAAQQGSVSVTVPGVSVSQALDLKAKVLAAYSPDPEKAAPGWLAQRVIAEATASRILLNSELAGFPTSAYSFKQQNIPDTPWRIVVSTNEPEAPFAHAVRLELNEDFPAIGQLIAGKPDPLITSELHSSIIRVLVGAVSHLIMDSSLGVQAAEKIAVEHPESITAAVQRIASQHLHLSLTEAITLYRSLPQSLEARIANSTGLLKGYK